MGQDSEDAIAEGWIALQHAEQRSRSHADNFWSHTELDDLLDNDPDKGWHVIQLIQAKDSSEKILSNLAAGPIEDLLVRHGVRFIQRIEDRAKADAQFRQVLSMVWQNSIDDAVWKKLCAARGR